MANSEEVLDENDAVLPNPQAILPGALKEVNVLFMGPVENGYFKPVSDKVNTPPRWEKGNYRLAAGKWPSPNLTADLMDLTPYNGYYIMVMASEWNEEVISQARIFGILNTSAGDVINKYAYEHLQEKEDEIATYISGIGN